MQDNHSEFFLAKEIIKAIELNHEWVGKLTASRQFVISVWNHGEISKYEQELDLLFKLNKNCHDVNNKTT